MKQQLYIGIVDQVRKAFQKKNRLATVCGFILGGSVLMSSYVLAHSEVKTNLWMWIPVLGALLFSALTVFQWATIAFQSKIKAVGFVLLTESVMTFSHTEWVSYVMLGILMGINGIATGCTLALDSSEARAEIRATSPKPSKKITKTVAKKSTFVPASENVTV
jgi:hypothetical protein